LVGADGEKSRRAAIPSATALFPGASSALPDAMAFASAATAADSFDGTRIRVRRRSIEE
jgi:hypothetical protein